MKWRLILAILIPPVLFLLFWQGFAQFMVTFRQAPFPGPASVLRELFSLVSGDKKLLGYTIFHHVGPRTTILLIALTAFPPITVSLRGGMKTAAVLRSCVIS
jgi:ABC-type nitrate/sulfonate/bicarbonate transport system permease component